MKAPDQQTAAEDAIFTISPISGSDEFVLHGKDGVPVGRVKQPMVSMLDNMTLLGRANMVRALSDFSNRYYPDAITSYLLARDDKGCCPQCLSTIEENPDGSKNDQCGLCGLNAGEMKPAAETLSSFDICTNCLAQDRSDEVGFHGSPSISLSFSRSQGRFWWVPSCSHFCVTHNEHEKWGPKQTCKFLTEHTIINKKGFLFPVLDSYWNVWRAVIHGQMMLSSSDSTYTLFICDAKAQQPNVNWETVFNCVIPRSLRYHTTASVRVLIARALSLERLERIMHRIREHKRYKSWHKNGGKAWQQHRKES